MTSLCGLDGTACPRGLCAEETHLPVCEHGKDGTDAEIVVCRRRKKAPAFPDFKQ